MNILPQFLFLTHQAQIYHVLDRMKPIFSNSTNSVFYLPHVIVECVRAWLSNFVNPGLKEKTNIHTNMETATTSNLRDKNRNDINDDEEQEKTKKSIFHSVKFYVFCQALINLSYLVLGAYLKSVITSIEKRFQVGLSFVCSFWFLQLSHGSDLNIAVIVELIDQIKSKIFMLSDLADPPPLSNTPFKPPPPPPQISSTKAGLIASGFEIGNLLVIIPISYLGSRVHRPRAIAIGSIIMMIGGVLLAIPHWIFDPYDPYSIHSSAASMEEKEELIKDSLCRANQTLVSNVYDYAHYVPTAHYVTGGHLWRGGQICEWMARLWKKVGGGGGSDLGQFIHST